VATVAELGALGSIEHMKHMTDKQLEAELCKAAVQSVKLAGEPPKNVRALAFDWRWVPDEHDRLGRLGFYITWKAYLALDLSDADKDYIDESTSYLVSYLWSRIVWIEDKLVVGGDLPAHIKNGWLYSRHENAA
jgi:hypothetical protein